MPWLFNDGLWIKKHCNTDYRCVSLQVTKNNTINMLGNSKLDNKGVLWIWILVQIKHMLK